MLLTFDPSSSAIGFAWSTAASELLQAGVITPESPRAPYLERLPGMLDEAWALVLELRPAAIAIEMPLQAFFLLLAGATESGPHPASMVQYQPSRPASRRPPG